MASGGMANGEKARIRSHTKQLLHAAWLSVSMSLCCASLFALDPNKHISQYAHRAWRVEDGTLPNSMGIITQTTDGYLWISELANGAFRFDGVRFVPWSSPAGPPPEFNGFLAAKNGGLWISSEHGVVHVDDQHVISGFDLQGPVFGNMVEDVDGSIWVIGPRYTGANKPLCHITDQSAHCFGEADGLPRMRSGPIALDGLGGLWLGSDKTLVHWRPGVSKSYEYKGLKSNTGNNGVLSIVPNSDGSVWVGIGRSGPGMGLERFVDGLSKPFVSGKFDGSKFAVISLLKDRDQNLWVGTDHDGLYRIHGEMVDHFGRIDGLSSDEVARIYEDREGVLWVTTTGGLDSFVDRTVTTYSRLEGLPTDDIVSVAATHDGTVWISNYGSLDSIRNGVVSSIRPKDGLPGMQVTSLLEDRGGHFWVGVDDGLFIYENRHFRRLPERNHRPLGMVVGMTEDVDGNIWAECASNPRKLVRIRDFQVQEEFSSAKVPAGHSLTADPKGGIWVSAVTGDLVRVRQGTVQTFRLNLKGETPHQIEAAPDGSVLVAAPIEGLIRMKLGKTQRLSKANGLPCDGVFGFVRDDQRNWWLEAPCGYLSIADSEMQRWWEHPDSAVKYRFFDVSEGARTALADFNSTTKSSDGRLWFATGVIAQSIDPSHLVFNLLPPPVRIEQIAADHKIYEVDSKSSQKVTLPAKLHDLEIDYTALSFVAPEKVFFRYKLDGIDHDWHDAGNRRQAFYTNLGPGKYHFHVIACNNSGVWNEQGAFVDFYVEPAYYQTTLFRVMCVILLLFLLWALYQVRLRQVKQQFALALEARVDERARIARDLHDTLLQSFNALLLRLQAVSNALPAKPEVARERIDGAIEQASSAIAEGRDAVVELRSGGLPTLDLAQSINTFAAEFLRASTKEALPDVRTQVEGMPRELSPIVRDEAYRIAAEALRNAILHSSGAHIEVEIRYDEQQLRLRIRDDGKGFDRTALNRGEAPRHWGLGGMRERAEVVGGELQIWSELDSGTEVELTIPAKRAYTKTAAWYRSLISRIRSN